MATNIVDKTAKKKFWLHGITFPNAKKIARREFKDKLLKVEQNNEKRTFDIYVKGPVDKHLKKEVEDAYTGFRVLEVVIKYEDK